MQVRKSLSHGSAAAALTLLAAALFLAAPTPAAAADGDFKGWYANLDVALTQPNGLDQDYGTGTQVAGTANSERFFIDNDADLTFRLDVGYSWGTKGSLQVSYWNFDNDDRADLSASYTGSYFTPTVSAAFDYYGSNPYYYGYGFLVGGDVQVQAGSEVDATSWGVDYVRDIPVGDKFRMRWLAGLRVAEYEETQAVLATGTYYFNYIAQASVIDSDAIGFRVGLTGVFEFSDSFALEGGLSVSFMQADVDGMSASFDDANVPSFFRAEQDNVQGEIRDYDIRAVWTAGPADYYVGYSSSTWSGIVSDPLAGPSGGNSLFFRSGGPARDEVSFNSLSAGIRWRFGGGT